jgi:hypothetical protein
MIEEGHDVRSDHEQDLGSHDERSAGEIAHGVLWPDPLC